jgi:hypothetical protein
MRCIILIISICLTACLGDAHGKLGGLARKVGSGLRFCDIRIPTIISDDGNGEEEIS